MMNREVEALEASRAKKMIIMAIHGDLEGLVNSTAAMLPAENRRAERAAEPARSPLFSADAAAAPRARRRPPVGLPAGLRLTPHSASANFKTEFEKRNFTFIKKKRIKPEISSSCNS